jgi:cytochrome P450
MSIRPELSLDLFTDAELRDPYPSYRAIRDLAPAVWLPKHEVWAIARYQDVRAALHDDDVLVSSQGVALNAFLNGQQGTTTLMSDGEAHRKRRSVLMKPMMPGALAAVRPRIEELADALVADLLTRDSFDGIADFARHLPVAVVSHLVGLPEEGRERMLEWASATFNALGPMNARTEASLPVLGDMIQYAVSVERARLDPNGWAAHVFNAVDAGSLEADAARGLLIDYIAPSLDTTLLGIGHMLYLLGTHPEQYDQLRENPELVPSAVNEALRVGSPVRAFTRVATRSTEIGEVPISEGDRVLILYGAANRDERHYAEPDRFDVTRAARDHLAFGHGVHRCAGSHLAQLEMESLLRALVASVRRIDVGEPRVLLSNMLCGYESFDASFR